jgi:cytochrome P450
VVYNMADVHLNEMVYSEPLKFDPSRFSPPREEDKQGHLLFLGWGAGRHICPGTPFTFAVYFLDNVVSGMKIAKLEIKIILALFLSSYEYTLVGESGMPLKQSLQPDRNDISTILRYHNDPGSHLGNIRTRPLGILEINLPPVLR